MNNKIILLLLVSFIPIATADSIAEPALILNNSQIAIVRENEHYSNASIDSINLSGKYQKGIDDMDAIINTSNTIINDASMTDAEQQAYIRQLAQNQKTIAQDLKFTFKLLRAMVLRWLEYRL